MLLRGLIFIPLCSFFTGGLFIYRHSKGNAIYDDFRILAIKTWGQAIITYIALHVCWLLFFALPLCTLVRPLPLASY